MKIQCPKCGNLYETTPEHYRRWVNAGRVLGESFQQSSIFYCNDCQVLPTPQKALFQIAYNQNLERENLKKHTFNSLKNDRGENQKNAFKLLKTFPIAEKRVAFIWGLPGVGKTVMSIATGALMAQTIPTVIIPYHKFVSLWREAMNNDNALFSESQLLKKYERVGCLILDDMQPQALRPQGEINWLFKVINLFYNHPQKKLIINTMNDPKRLADEYWSKSNRLGEGNPIAGRLREMGIMAIHCDWTPYR